MDIIKNNIEKILLITLIGILASIKFPLIAGIENSLISPFVSFIIIGLLIIGTFKTYSSIQSAINHKA